MKKHSQEKQIIKDDLSLCQYSLERSQDDIISQSISYETIINLIDNKNKKLEERLWHLDQMDKATGKLKKVDCK